MRRIEFLDTEIAAVERLIAQDALDSPEIRRLMSVPGVNVIVAASFLAAIGDIDRFKSPRGVSELLDRIAIPQPWRGTVEASLALIEDLERQIDEINHELRSSGVDHRYVPLLLTVPGIAWVLAFTIAAEIGDIERFAMAKKLVGYTGLCPRVNQSGDKDRRGPLSKHGTRCLRWAMLEATMHALRHPVYCERYQRNKQRLGRQRGAKVAQIDIARRLTEAIWHMLTTNQPFNPTAAAGGGRSSSGRPTAPFGIAPPQPASHDAILPPRKRYRDERRSPASNRTRTPDRRCQTRAAASSAPDAPR